MNEMNLGIASYTKEQWELLKKYATDKGELDLTYNHWEENRDRTIEFLRSQGYKPVLVQIDVAELEAWCHAQHKKNTGSSRAEFCSQKLRERNGQPGVCGYRRPGVASASTLTLA
jgi:hypothetical protein